MAEARGEIIIGARIPLDKLQEMGAIKEIVSDTTSQSSYYIYGYDDQVIYIPHLQRINASRPWAATLAWLPDKDISSNYVTLQVTPMVPIYRSPLDVIDWPITIVGGGMLKIWTYSGYVDGDTVRVDYLRYTIDRSVWRRYGEQM